jgi:heterodisulfide reductase subunit A
MEHKRVMVIGGGIAGVQAALDLGEMGIEVLLVENGPSIGGRMAQLDKTFPTNDCAMCILSPKLVEAGSHPYIRIITNTEVKEIAGEAPQFRVKLLQHPRYVDVEKCTGCGACTDKCPVKIPDPYNKGLSMTKCIRVPFPQAVPAAAIIDETKCLYLTRGKCRVCSKVCEADAIDYDQKPEKFDVEVGSIVLAAGTSEFNAVLKDEYGYKTFPNVVTSIEFERILSASGPSRGHVVRPSDGVEPKRIAFLQCVGSRDSQVGNEYCSSICCMQAAKDAIILGEHLDDVETTVFFMDIRAYGKHFDRFIEKAEIEQGCRFLRARISSVEFDPRTDNVVVQYSLHGSKVTTEAFDMLVLSVGLVMNPEQRHALEALGLSLNEQGFVRVPSYEPVRTLRSGTFVCGSLSGPKDIPESVVEASAAAAEAASVVANLPRAEFAAEYPPERDIRGEPPRIGVFVCNCGINIGSVVDVPAVVKHAKLLPNVEHAQEFLFTCSQDAQKIISDVITEKNLNRVIVAACTPRTHEPLFQKTLQETGLNPYLFEFVNIREQCSWVHQKEPEKATQKAKKLLGMSVSKALLLEPLSKMTLGVNKAALVIGGGVAGMTAALELAAQDFPVHLVEKESKLGGNLRHVHYTYNGEETAPFLKSLIERVRTNPQIALHSESRVEGIEGYVGNFQTTLSDVADPIEHGVVVVATGALAVEPIQYLYGKDKRVLTQRQFEERLVSNDPSLRTLRSVVMIQCVESRDEDRPYCSRVCCSTAVKNALKFKGINPGANIHILYRDVRTYGLKELRYREAREKGVLFCRYEKDKKPTVSVENGELIVKVDEKILERRLILNPDLVVLSSGVTPNPENKALSQLLKVPLGPDGFFLEAHVKLRPVDFATDGVFVCGMAHYPKDLSEAIAQAKAAAGRAATVLSKASLETEGKVASVVEARCSGCGTCVEVCAYKAIELDPETGRAVVNEALCKGCGLCSASCRAAAIDLKGFANEQILAMLEAVG